MPEQFCLDHLYVMQMATANSFQVLTLGFVSIGDDKLGFDRFLYCLGVNSYYGTIIFPQNLVYFVLHKSSTWLPPILFASSFHMSL